MKPKRMRIALSLTILFFVGVFLLGEASEARIPPSRDQYGGALDASVVAIVRNEANDIFQVQEAFIGSVAVGDKIEIPGFKLYTVPMYGPKIVEPITPETRVLVFLTHNKERPGTWKVVRHGYCFFWVHDPNEVDRLRSMGNRAVSFRKSWEEARDTAGDKERVEALWSYIWSHGARVSQRTRNELKKTRSVAGDYIAERLETMPGGKRTSLLGELGAYGGKALHKVLLKHLKDLQQLYEDFLKDADPDLRKRVQDPHNPPNAIRSLRGELYSGLVGLASFKDPNDLPFLRELAWWAVGYRLKQTCDGALNAFRDMPDKSNLAVIEAIWKEFSERPYEGSELSVARVTRALRTHKFPETVPVLVQLLADKEAGREAQFYLSEIVGNDFGSDPNSWLRWYEVHKASEQQPRD